MGRCWYFDEAHNLRQHRNTDGHTTTYIYSPTGKLLTTTLPAIGGQPAAVIENRYDARDWLEKTIDPTGRSITYGRNAAGQIVTETNSLNETITHEYDADGRKRATFDGLNQPTKWVRDGRGNPTLTVDALNQSTSMGYDGAGQLMSITNRQGATTAFTYDAAGRQKTLRKPLGRLFETTYNSRGLVATTKEPSGQTTTYASHNALGLPLTRSDADGSIAMTYDPLGRISTLTENGQTISLGHAGWNATNAYYTDATGEHLSCRRTRFNGSYKVLSMRYGYGSKQVIYSYDARGRLTTVTDWTGRVTSFTYDAAGRLLTLTRPNGTRRTQTYDLAGRLETVQDVRVNDGATIVSLEMRYDAAGRLWAKRQLPAWPAVPPQSPRTAITDADNRLENVGGTPVTHDADGNVLSAPSALGIGVQTYAWNVRNQLVGGYSGVTRTYDALGNWISMTANGTTTTYAVDPVGGSMPRVLWSKRGTEERENGVRLLIVTAI